jgi:hypothetical protein
MSMVLRVTFESLGLRYAVILDKIDLLPPSPLCSRERGLSTNAGATATTDGDFDRSRGRCDGS